jgi:HK97 family phage prohead protease
VTDASKPYGDVQYADPGYQKDGKKRYPLDTEAHCRAAWSYIHQAKNRTPYTAEQLKAIEGRIRAAGKKFGIEFSDTASRSDPSATFAVDDETPRAPIEFRDAISSAAGVNFAQRIIELVAVPYEQSGLAEYRSELWNEQFMRGSFDGIEKRPNRVRANRDHDDRRLVGKAVKFWPSREDGLVAEVRISQTPLGDETLALANDGVLSTSVGFAARGRDQEFERRSMTRRIRKAFLDHIAFTPTPTYRDAGVISVRHSVQPVSAEALQKLDTPNLDELRDWLNTRKR